MYSYTNISTCLRVEKERAGKKTFDLLAASNGARGIAPVPSADRHVPRVLSQISAYRGTSLMRNTPLLGPFSRTIPRVLWWS